MCWVIGTASGKALGQKGAGEAENQQEMAVWLEGGEGGAAGGTGGWRTRRGPPHRHVDPVLGWAPKEVWGWRTTCV